MKHTGSLNRIKTTERLGCVLQQVRASVSTLHPPSQGIHDIQAKVRIDTIVHPCDNSAIEWLGCVALVSW